MVTVTSRVVPSRDTAYSPNSTQPPGRPETMCSVYSREVESECVNFTLSIGAGVSVMAGPSTAGASGGAEATLTRTISTLVGLPRVMTLYRVSLMNASLPPSVILAWIA